MDDAKESRRVRCGGGLARCKGLSKPSEAALRAVRAHEARPPTSRAEQMRKWRARSTRLSRRGASGV